MLVGTDKSHSVPLDLKLHDLATVDWVAVSAESRAPLPLAEIRMVKIAQIAAGAAASVRISLRRRIPLAGCGLPVACLGRDTDGGGSTRTLAIAR